MDKIYLIFFLIFRFFIKNTPESILNFALNNFALLLYLIDKKHRKIIRVNLDFAFKDKLDEKEKTDIVKKCYKNLVFNLADFIKNQGISKDELLQKVKFVNQDILENAIKNGKKIIFFSAHYGNWEIFPLAVSAKFSLPLTVIGRRLDSPSLNKILKKNREQFSIEMIEKKGAAKEMINALKNGRALAILVDQNTAENEGILIDFFSKKARHTSSVAQLAKKFDAVAIPFFVSSNDYKNFTITFYDSIVFENTDNTKEDIKNFVQKQASITEQIIREKPDEWFWFHKRWKNQYEEIYQNED